MTVVDLKDVAIIIRPEKDNVAVVKADFIEKGAQLQHNGTAISLSGRALRGQSFAIRDIARGKPYVSLGDPIGLAACDVRAGDPV
ncbi:MAG: SAF domain-containing protein, partial [Terriglobia bacterium]